MKAALHHQAQGATVHPGHWALGTGHWAQALPSDQHCPWKWPLLLQLLPQSAVTSIDVPRPCFKALLAPGSLHGRGPWQFTNLGVHKGCWDFTEPQLSVRWEADTATSPQDFKMASISSRGRRGHQMTDNQKE